MTRLACCDNSLFDVSDMEIAAKGLSYTVETLEAFAAREECETFFILGTDSLREIHTWKDYERLFGLAHFIVVTRPGVDFGAAWAALPEHTRVCFREEGDHLVHHTARRVMPAEVVGLNVSSTTVRQLLRAGKSVRYLVTEPVRSYISGKNLYRNQ
jgi:nicotinate-nucleotide adenylyltransferase